MTTGSGNSKGVFISFPEIESSTPEYESYKSIVTSIPNNFYKFTIISDIWPLRFYIIYLNLYYKYKNLQHPVDTTTARIKLKLLENISLKRYTPSKKDIF